MRTPILLATLAALVAPAVAHASPKSTHVANVAASDGKRPIDLFDDVVFDTNSKALSAAELPHIDAAARWLKHHPGTFVVLQGRADRSGSDAYNEGLATHRLEMVRDHMHADGIAMDRIVLVVYGEADATQHRVNPLDRSVEMYATTNTPTQIANAELDKTRALSVVWTQRGMLIREHNGIHGERTSATARR